jgi:hypothetical protein
MRALLRTLTLGLLCTGAAPAYAYFELSANGSYYKYNNGQTLGDANTTTVQRLGAGVAYNLFGNALIELKYTTSKNFDQSTQESIAEGNIYRIRRMTEFHNYGVNLVLEFAPRRAQFRPYVSGGVGYMTRKSSMEGTYEDALLRDGETPLQFRDEPAVSSISADGGVGFKLFVAERIAIEGSFNVFATDLDKESIYLHYSAAGGLRFIF